MESVEDIPAEALNAGIRWEWESFPEYLDAVATLPRADRRRRAGPARPAAHLRDGRARLRQRAGDRRRHRAMAALVEDAVRAGALGFSTNRLPAHTAPDGRPAARARTRPSTSCSGSHGAWRAAAAAWWRSCRRAAWASRRRRLPRRRRAVGDPALAARPEPRSRSASRRPTATPTCGATCSAGSPRPTRRARTSTRRWPVDRSASSSGCRRSSSTPGVRPTTRSRDLPLAERARALADPERRRRILDTPNPGIGIGRFIEAMADRVFPLDDPPDYEPRAGAEHRGPSRARGSPRRRGALRRVPRARRRRACCCSPSVGTRTATPTTSSSMLSDDNAVLGPRRRRRALRR